MRKLVSKASKNHRGRKLNNIKKKFSIVYADPAYRFSDANTGGSFKSGSSNKYLTMSMDEIAALPVAEITKPDAFLFLWIPDSLLSEAMQIFEAWGFKYKKKAFTWIKKTVHGKDFVGMGQTTRNGSEDLYLGVKGKPKVISHSVRQVQYAKLEGHSRKPDLFRELILDLCGKKRTRIELFARRSCCGFHIWGNEAK